jgi:hemerythrin-like domain-containing protein
MSQTPDTRDMTFVHNVFREAVQQRDAYLGTLAGDNTERAQAVGLYYDTILQFIQSHHAAEDTSLWPRLLERAPEHEATIRHGMNQHAALHAQLDAAQAALAAWRGATTDANREALVAALADMESVMIEHLNDEEQNVVPICAQHLSVEEWGELPVGTLTALQGANLMICIGLVRDAFDDTLREQMDAHMPPPLKEAWLNEGQPLYQSTMQQVRS